MFPRFQGRAAHYALLLAVTACLFLPALGAPSLWDIDEGHNAECAREMLESNNWTVPTFNFKLRVDKPVLLYWLQIAAFQVFGIGEFAARLPSALAALLTVLLTYELGRRLFDRTAGLFAGLMLASAALFCGSAHFANPDALLYACTVLTFLLFWRDFERVDGAWPAAIGLSMGLGFLAKGPVALVLPLTVIGLYVLWTRQLRRVFGLQALVGGILFVLVAVPWFVLVGTETKGEFLRGFFLTHNRDRFLASMEGHRGPFFYHAISLIVGFVPWSAFFGPALWYAVKDARRPEMDERERKALKFLACWIAVFFVFFSVSQTKLPNYILPLYPAVALGVGRYLSRWRAGAIVPPAWLTGSALATWALVGVGTTFGLLVAGGAWDLGVRRHLAGLEQLAWIGAVLVVGAVAAGLFLGRRQFDRAFVSLATAAVAFTASAVIWGATALDAHKAPRALVETAQAVQPDREVRIGCFAWYQPSLVFYCQREVVRIEEEGKALEFLGSPLPVYLFLPARTWDGMASKVAEPCRLLGRHFDFYRNCEVVVVTNR